MSIKNDVLRVLENKVSSDLELKIGVYGSSFDPVTNAHLWTAAAVMNRKKLDIIILLPSNSKLRPDGKKAKTEDNHRIEMLKLAIENNDNFVISDYEIKKDFGYVTTYDTMTHFKSLFPKSKLYFIMGADLLLELSEWHDGKELIENFNFIVMARDNIDMLKAISKDPILRNNDVEGKFNLIDKGLSLEVSSTFIRDELARGGEPRYLLPENCYQYMKQHKLYTDPLKNRFGVR
jgi:nicotinate (nicotinamide) nucleotide adenylyltransferase